MEYQVEHSQWKVWAASETTLSGNMIGFYGSEFASALASRPSSAFIAVGSSLTVREGRARQLMRNASPKMNQAGGKIKKEAG